MSDQTYEAMCDFADKARAATARDEAALEQAEAALEQAAGDTHSSYETWLAARGEKMISDGEVVHGALVRCPAGEHPQEIGQVCDIDAPEGFQGQVFVSWPWGSMWQYAARLEVLTPEAAIYDLSRRVYIETAPPHHPGDPRHDAWLAARQPINVNIIGDGLTPEKVVDAMKAAWPAGQVGRALTHGAAKAKIEELTLRLDEATNCFADDLHEAQAACHSMQAERDKALEELAQHKVWLEESQALCHRTSEALGAVDELARGMERERDEARATLADVTAARDELARDLAAAKSARTVAETDKAAAVHEMRHALRKVEVMMGERDTARELLGEDVQLRKGLERDLEQARAALASKPASMFYHQIEAKLEDVKGDLCAALDERDEARRERDIAQRSLEAARAVGRQIEAERDAVRADLHRAQLQSKALEAAIARHGEALAVEKARAQEARQDAEQTRKAGVQDREELEDCHKRMKAAEAAAKRAEEDAAEQRQVLINERNRAARDIAKLRIDVAKLTAALHGHPAAQDGDCEAKHP